MPPVVIFVDDKLSNVTASIESNSAYYGFLFTETDEFESFLIENNLLEM